MQKLVLAQFMTRGIETLPREASVREVVERMENARLSCVLIVEAGRPVGIVSERDCVKWLGQALEGRDWSGVPVSEVMTSPVIAVSSDLTWLEALELVRRRRIRRLPVVDQEGLLVGLVTQSDLLQAQRLAFQFQREELEVEIAERTRELTQARDAAEAALHGNMQFLATMTHEIRTPLGGVVSVAELLRETPLSAQQLEWVSTIIGSGNGLTTLVNDILDYAKMDGSQVEVERVEFDLLEVLEEVADLSALKAQTKGVEFRLVYDPLAPSRIVSDPARLRQLVTNLCGNAVKFTDDGEVALHVHFVEREGSRAHLRIEVRDTGIGISKEQQARLFQAYAQANASISRRFGGTGLGLAISKKLVEAMGGSIGVTSVPDVGSTFWFELDVGLVERPQSVPSKLGATVAILDPNPSSATDLRRNLSGLGVEARLFETAAAALEARQAGATFDAAFVRYPLQDRGDRRKLDLLREEAPSLPVYVVTDIADHALAAGMAHHGYAGALTRPVKRRPLHDALANLLRVPDLIVPAQSRGLRVQNRIARENARILLAEDNKVNQMVLQNQLRRLGFKCTLADDGEQALKAFRERAWDLVLMDCRMPILDGPDATRAMRGIEQERGAGRTKVLALTAGGTPEEREQCLASGMDGFLTKPVPLDQLEEALETHLQINRAATLTPMQTDALTELMNIGVGLGAAQLSVMLERPVELSVPSVVTVIEHELQALTTTFETGEWSSVELGFEGPFRGSATLLFSERGVRSLVNALGGIEGPEGTNASISPEAVEEREEVVVEVGNIVLNALVGSFSNTLGQGVAFDVPSFARGSVGRLLASDHYFGATTLLMARTHFVIRDLEVEGIVLALLGLSAFERLLDIIDEAAGEAA